MTGIGVGIACVMWLVGFSLWAGLPSYYRQAPGKVPSFYKTLFRRKIIVVSKPLNRSLRCSIDTGLVVLLHGHSSELLAFGTVWSQLALPLVKPTRLCLENSHRCGSLLPWRLGWIPLPLQHPLQTSFMDLAHLRHRLRSAQVVSNAVVHVQYRHVRSMGWRPRSQCLCRSSPVALARRFGRPSRRRQVQSSPTTLFLLLTASSGFGMILLNTLTRFHIAFTLIAAQVLGSIATILARATAPNKIGPGDVFPDFSAGYSEGLSKAWFWIALIFQLSINLICFLFFRKEQLAKP